MRFCDNCGCGLNERNNFCPNCGKALYCKDNNSTAIICGIVGFLFPIIGAILYYVFKGSNYKAANIANLCSWVGFVGYILFWIIRLRIIFIRI